MLAVQNYRDLLVWQKAMDFSEFVFRITETFPKNQQYVLTAQLQRSVLSVPSNIAEGRSRHSVNDFIYHLNIARGSLAEAETQLMLSHRLGFIDDKVIEQCFNYSEEMTKMLFGLRASLKSDTNNKKAKTYNLQTRS